MHDASENTAASFPELELSLEANESFQRRGEPVTCGIPWPRGVLRDPSRLRLHDSQGAAVPLQTRILDRWSDDSVRWLLLDWQANARGGAPYRLRLGDPNDSSPVCTCPIRIERERKTNREHPVLRDYITVDTGAARFEVGSIADLVTATINGAKPQAAKAILMVETSEYGESLGQIERAVVEEEGPLRSVVRLEGSFWIRPAEKCPFAARLHFFAGSPTVRFALTLRNPHKAEHAGGLWDLGNGGSIYLKNVRVFAFIPSDDLAESAFRCSPEPGAAFQSGQAPLELYQDSSGGANWKSTNHLNRNHIVPNTFCGFRLRWADKEQTGQRATPIAQFSWGASTLAMTMPAFWQNFPKSLEGRGAGLTLRLFPSQYADLHELQGGEQKTHEFYIAFGPDPVTEEPLAWARSPLFAHASPEWYCSCGVIPCLTPRDSDPNAEYLRLVDAAIEGDDTFDHKREVIDEYGWRHFGDIYGDHEAVFHKGPTPLVSHYNNQYDAIAGFAYQFLRSGDRRWFRHMDELAAHIADIDIYHTDKDKSAYNHGLFWHTFHYVDADTGTHRSYPRAAKVCGGGPANEQNYTTGLMLHHFLTGNQASRKAALELARWVIDMDDGRKTIFRWLAGGYTGLASSSRTPLYHGPGRGAANSLAVLLDGHRLSGDSAFLEKAEQLIRRCIHPDDNVPARNLLDAENRWFYLMFLQSLGRYLDYKAERGELDYLYAYARASLLQYARWMAEHEYPYLDKPEILEYPTETWVAQDMRKSEVFKYAARHADGPERERFLERSEFFFRYCTRTLSGMETRTLARPVVLMLSFGWMHAWVQGHGAVPAPPPVRENHDFGRPTVFVPQKVKARRRLKALVAASALTVFAGLIVLLVLLLT